MRHSLAHDAAHAEVGCCGVAPVAACTAIAALGAEPTAAAAGSGRSSWQQDATARVKREAGVKRERQQGADDDDFVPRSATAAERVDLTEEVSGIWLGIDCDPL
jgi:hypothetical protein